EFSTKINFLRTSWYCPYTACGTKKEPWVYIIKKFVLTKERETIFQEFINQCPV
ncbi:MAG: hypothetical protein ACI90V_002343, partial [Bacillariaceae sp.]